MSVRAATDGSFITDRSGTAAVEFAIILPVFIVLLLGMAQFAYAQHCASSLHFALRTASRSLMLNPSLTEVQLADQVKAELAVLGDPDVRVTMAVRHDGNGRVAELKGRYAHTINLPLVDKFPIVYLSTVSTALSTAPL